MKAPVGLLSDGTVCVSRWRGFAPTSSMQGDDTIDTRLEMFRHQREALTQQIQQLQHTLETVEYKCWFYEAAKAAGTVDVPGAMADADVPDQFRAIRQELRGQKMPNIER